MSSIIDSEPLLYPFKEMPFGMVSCSCPTLMVMPDGALERSAPIFILCQVPIAVVIDAPSDVALPL